MKELMNDSAGLISIDFDSSDFQKKLKSFEKNKEVIIQRLIRKVNNEVKKEWKKAARSRGYSAHKIMPWGDAGFQDNVFTFANRDGTGKIMFARDAFQYRFVEDGFSSRSGKFIPGKHIFKPLAEQHWEQRGSAIMEKQLQKEFEKLEKKGLVETTDND